MKILKIIAILLLATTFHSFGKDDVGTSDPERKPIIIKPVPTHLSGKQNKEVSTLEHVLPGTSYTFAVSVGEIPSGHLDNGKLKMRFQAFRVRVDKHQENVWKLSQLTTTPLSAGNFSGGTFTGNNVLELTPESDENEFTFTLDEEEFEGEDDGLLLIIGRAAFPATGTESVVYEAGIIYTLICPE